MVPAAETVEGDDKVKYACEPRRDRDGVCCLTDNDVILPRRPDGLACDVLPNNTDARYNDDGERKCNDRCWEDGVIDDIDDIVDEGIGDGDRATLDAVNIGDDTNAVVGGVGVADGNDVEFFDDVVSAEGGTGGTVREARGDDGGSDGDCGGVFITGGINASIQPDDDDDDDAPLFVDRFVLFLFIKLVSSEERGVTLLASAWC
jgi:hypothetical protein